MTLSKQMLIVVTLTLVLGAVAVPARATVRYVDASRPDNSGNGLSWAAAERTLQAALIPSVNGDEIWVAAGTYTPTGPGGARTVTHTLKSGVKVYGGFAGDEVSLDERDPVQNVTILSGDLNGDDGPGPFDNNAENSYHVVTGSNTSATTLLDGFTITGGNANGGIFPHDDSGGLVLTNGHATIRRCVFRGNSATQTAGAIGASGSNSLITDCVFIGNVATFGGGVSFFDGAPSIVNCLFAGNSATINGGGADNFGGSSPTYANCVFSGNTAGWGAGINVVGTVNARLINCTYAYNAASTFGGGVRNWDTPGTVLENCVLWGNTAPFGGAQIGEDNAPATVNYSIIQSGWGGAGGNNLTADPLFVDPDGADNILGTEDDDVRLLETSPGIDAGNNSAVPPGVTTDPDGHPRIVGGVVDRGAYELFLGDCNDNGLLDECELDCAALAGECNIPGCGLAADCNANMLLDSCEIADCGGNLACGDCNSNDIPDECESPTLDCNDNAVADVCDLADCTGEMACSDCNLNGIPDGCDIPSGAFETFAAFGRVPETIAEAVPPYDAGYYVPDAREEFLWHVSPDGATVTPFSSGQFNPIDAIFVPDEFGGLGNRLFVANQNESFLGEEADIMVIDAAGVSTIFASVDLGGPGSGLGFSGLVYIPQSLGGPHAGRLLAFAQSDSTGGLAGDAWSFEANGTGTHLGSIFNASTFTPVLAPAAYGALGGSVFIGETNGARVFRFDPQTIAVTTFVTLDLLPEQPGLRQMAFSPVGWFQFLDAAFTGESLLVVSVSGSQQGKGTNGALAVLDSTGTEVARYTEEAVGQVFDPRGLRFVGERLLVSNAALENGGMVSLSILAFTGGDCDENGVLDGCDRADCLPNDPSCQDCQGNGFLDSCDLAACAGDLPCGDCNANGIPDGCESPIIDCNNNGIADVCDLADCAGDPACADIDGNLLPDECDVIVDLAMSQAYLDSVTSVAGSLSMVNVPGRTTLSMPNLTDVALDVLVTGNADLTTLDMPLLETVGRHVDVSFNPVLGAVVLDGLGVVGGDLAVSENVSATTISIPGLTSTGGDLTVSENISATTISIPGLTSTGGDLTVSENVSATTISIPGLTSTGGDLTVSENISATTISIPGLTSTDGDLTVSENVSATTISIPGLTSTGGDLTVSENVSATTISIPGLTSVGEDVTITNNLVADSVSLPALAGTVQSVTITNNPAATTIDLTALTSTTGDFSVSNNDLGVTISFPGLSSVGGDFSVSNTDLGVTISFPGLSSVGGDFSVSNTDLGVTISFPGLSSVGGDFSVSNTDLGVTISFPGLSTVGGDFSVSNNDLGVTISFPGLSSVGGDFSVSNNDLGVTISFPGLSSTGGDLTITNNPAATTINLDSLLTVAGHMTVETQGQTTVDLSTAAVAGDVDLHAAGAMIVSALTPGGSTAVEMANTEATLETFLPLDAFAAPVPFSVEHLPPAGLTAAAGLDPESTPIVVDPVAGYAFDFETPALNEDGEVVIEVDVAGLGEPTATDFLTALEAGNVTMAVQGDGPNDPVLTYRVCEKGESPEVDDCVERTLLDDARVLLPPGSPAPAYVVLRVVVNHFSTYSAVMTGPLPGTPEAEPGGTDEVRFVSFVVPAEPAAMETALRVELTSLHHPSGPPPGTPNFAAQEGTFRYVNSFGGSTTCVDSTTFATNFRCGQLGCQPEYRDWLATLSDATNPASAAGLIHVTGDTVVPSSTLTVSQIAAGCGAAPSADACSAASASLAVSTSRWGDVGSGGGGPPDGAANVIDIGLVVDNVKGLATALSERRAWMKNPANPFGNPVNVIDIGLTVDAVKGLPYPYGIDACP